jgi:outer membrane protein, heavy metal efflux system
MHVRSWAARALVVAIASGTGAARAENITIDEAVARALAGSPEIAQAAADVAVSEGSLQGARTLPFNPELSAVIGPSFGGGRKLFGNGKTLLDTEVSLSQTIEIGGKRGRRIDGAQARRGAARSLARWTRWEVSWEVRRAFHLALVARDRLATAREAESMAAEIKRATDERLRRGAGTELEVNVAAADAGRAARERLDAERHHAAAKVELAAAIGAPARADLEPVGTLPTFPDVEEPPDVLVARALARRPDLRAARAQRMAAEADVGLEDSLRVPDLTFSFTYGREEDVDLTREVLLVGLSVPLPLFNRNQGGRASARAELTKARIAERATGREVERQVRAARAAYRKAREAVLAFDRDVIEKLGENLSLARQSFQTGKIGLIEFNVVRRDLVETRLSYLDALEEAVQAWTTLELLIGEAEGSR